MYALPGRLSLPYQPHDPDADALELALVRAAR
jgi:hypothetical protein